MSEIGFLFDLEGVIIDSESEYTRIWSQIESEFPTNIPDFPTKIKGCTLSKILNDNYETQETRDAVAKRLHQLEQQMHYEYLPFAKEFLQILKDNNIPAALVTSSDNKKMSHLWEELPDLQNFFSHIITGDLVKTSKPSPEGYLLAAKKIGRKPENCFVFEDSLQGVMAGKNAGAFVVGVCGTLTPDILAPYSHILINNFGEINLDSLLKAMKSSNCNECNA